MAKRTTWEMWEEGFADQWARKRACEAVVERQTVLTAHYEKQIEKNTEALEVHPRCRDKCNAELTALEASAVSTAIPTNILAPTILDGGDETSNTTSEQAESVASTLSALSFSNCFRQESDPFSSSKRVALLHTR